MKKKKKIVFASQDTIKVLQPYVDKVLIAIGHPSAFVSDESMIGDFSPFESYTEDGKKKMRWIDPTDFLRDMSCQLGFDVKGDDYIYALAERLRREAIDSE